MQEVIGVVGPSVPCGIQGRRLDDRCMFTSLGDGVARIGGAPGALGFVTIDPETSIETETQGTRLREERSARCSGLNHTS